MRMIEVVEFVKINANPYNMLDVARVLVSFKYDGREYRMIIPYDNENLDNPAQVQLLLTKAVNHIDDMTGTTKKNIDNLSNTLHGIYTLPNR